MKSISGLFVVALLLAACTGDDPAPLSPSVAVATATPGATSTPAPVLTPAATFSPAPAFDSFARVVAGKGDCLNIRSRASLDGEVLACTADGELVTLVGRPLAGDAWVLVSISGARIPGRALTRIEGWANTRFLEIEPRTDEPARSTRIAEVREGLAEQPGILDLVDTVERGDIEAVLAAFARVTAGCHYRREGGEGTSTYSECGEPPASGETFEAIMGHFDLPYVAGEERIRRIMHAMIRGGLPQLDRLWFAPEGEWLDLGEQENPGSGPRYLLSFAVPEVDAGISPVLWGDGPYSGFTVSVIPGDPPRLHEFAMLLPTWSSDDVWRAIEKTRLFHTTVDFAAD